jgi:hypothetical protein
MKVIIAGSRSLVKISIVLEAVQKSGFNITEVVSGCATGADSLGEYYAFQNNIPIKKFPADWDKHNKSAGPIRNSKMASYADAAIVIWDGVSKGSKHMIYEMSMRKKPCYTHIFVTDNFLDDVE